MADTRPNILILWTDEQRADTLAAYGNTHGVTPCLDRFARDATVFQRAYCTSPVCTPARGSVMTGLYPHHHGAIANNVPLRTDARCLPEWLPDYTAAYVGKWHLGDEIFAQHGFETWINVDDGYRGFYRPGRDRAARCPYHHWLTERGYQPNQADGAFTRDFVARLPEAHSKPRFQADCAIEFINRQPEGGSPWILSVNTLEPHMPFTGPRDDQYDPADLPLPKNAFVPPDDSCLLRTRTIHALQSHRPHAGCLPGDETSVRRTLANYWGLCSQVDHHFGRILNALAESGQWDNTLVVFTSDHGDQMGCHGLIAKTVMFEESARVPLLLKLPGQRSGRTIRGPVSQVDLVPTILDAAGAGSNGLDGTSLLPALRGETGNPERDVALVWHVDDGADNDNRLEGKDAAWQHLGSRDRLERALRGESRCLVTPDGWKLTVSDQGECELYDLNADPHELANLAPRPAHASRRHDLHARLKAWQARVGDPLAL